MSFFFINLFIIALAFFEFAWGISVFFQERKSAQLASIIPFFTVFSALICAGYALAGLFPDISKAFIPRIFGIWGWAGLLLSELALILYDLKAPKLVMYISIGIGDIWGITDMIIYGKRSACNYIRNDFYNMIEIADRSAHVFHYVFLGVTGAILLMLSIKWYKTKTMKRDRRFIVQIIFANIIVFFATLPDVFYTGSSYKYSTLSFCIALAVFFFVWINALQKRISFSASAKDINEGIFSCIEIPVIIFSMEGIISLYNPAAKEKLALEKKEKLYIHDVLRISDVEEMRLFAKAKNGGKYELKALCYATQKMCLLKCRVKLDDTGEPYCIVGTIMAGTQDSNNENEEGNL